MTAATAPQTGSETARPAVSAPSVRTAIGILVTRFPRIDETFILREINELERHGQPVVLIPLLRDHGTVVHEEAKPWIGRALYMPLISRVILLANFRRLLRQPRKYLGLLAELILGTMFRPRVLIRTLALFPKSVYLAEVLPRLGVRHLHAHFAVHPTTMAYIVHSLANVTYSFTVHGPDVFAHRMLLRKKIARAKFVRAVSTFVKAYVTGLYPDDATGKIEVIHIGVNPEVYADAVAGVNQNRARTRIVSVAALTDAKGFSFLVDACARLVQEGIDLECVIVGEGPTRAGIAARIAQNGLGDRVRMTGVLPQHEVARLVADCDIFVLPSVIAYNGQMDGIPISLMEAMAAGRPVIGSAISGIPELVEHGVSGILVDATHTERIAESIRLLVGDPELRDRMGRAGQEKVRREFDVRRTSAAMIDLFERHPSGRRTVAQGIASLDWRQLNTVAVGLRRVRERPDSFIAELTVTDGISRRDVVVKQHRESGDGELAFDRANKEFDVLTRLRASMDMADETATGVIYSLPRVLVFDSKHAAIIMERATGKPLDGLIRQSRNRGMAGRVVIPMRRAGTWLRRMQTATRSGEDGRNLLASSLLRALRDLDLASAVDYGIFRHRSRIAEMLRELERRMAERPLPIVGSHGDYSPANIFVGGQRVDVIDFEEYREGLALEDVAYFLINLQLALSYPIIGRGLDRLEHSFLAGYSDGTDLDVDALKFFATAKALQMLARRNEAPRGIKAWLHQRALRKIVLAVL